MVKTKVTSSASPWLVGMKNEVYDVPISHGEGRLTVSLDDLNKLINHHQIAFQYVDDHHNPTYDPNHNPNGSTYAIEGIISEDGLILGKMGHSERVHADLYKNFKPVQKQNIFINAVNYFKQRGTDHESSL
jgi:phosphoribosylformylglycinamidine synthase